MTGIKLATLETLCLDAQRESDPTRIAHKAFAYAVQIGEITGESPEAVIDRVMAAGKK